MAIKPTSDPDVIKSNSNPGCMALFGLPFFLAGCAVIVGVFLAGESGEGEGLPWFVGIPFGGIFATVGALFLFGRWGIIVNRRAKTIVKWWGLLIPMYSKSDSLEGVNHVSITSETRRSSSKHGSRTYTVYPVRLQGGGKKIDIEEPRETNEARARGEALAKFLQVELHDRSSGELVQRAADELDLSLRDLAKRRGEVAELPQQPTTMDSAVTVENETATIDIPAPGLRLQFVIPLVMSLIIPALVCAFFLPAVLGMNMPPLIMLIFGGFIGVFFVLLPLVTLGGGALRSAFTRERVIASPELLRVERGWLRTFGKEIPANELEELTVGKGKRRRNMPFSGLGNPVVARSDRLELRFGQHLDRREAEYVCALVKAVLTA